MHWKRYTYSQERLATSRKSGCMDSVGSGKTFKSPVWLLHTPSFPSLGNWRVSWGLSNYKGKGSTHLQIGDAYFPSCLSISLALSFLLPLYMYTPHSWVIIIRFPRTQTYTLGSSFLFTDKDSEIKSSWIFFPMDMQLQCRDCRTTTWFFPHTTQFFCVSRKTKMKLLFSCSLDWTVRLGTFGSRHYLPILSTVPHNLATLYKPLGFFFPRACEKLSFVFSNLVS